MALSYYVTMICECFLLGLVQCWFLNGVNKGVVGIVDSYHHCLLLMLDLTYFRLFFQSSSFHVEGFPAAGIIIQS